MADHPQLSAARPALAIQGKWIVDVGDLGDLRRRMPKADLIDVRDATIAPSVMMLTSSKR
ncbi:hypothetical protein [Saccharopolyspora phatthalungensis]|uniref:Uncharacterized protein n=1 Tax=Saccharopolyspora phatthalungensis TaxID=664693 RepID=A0A840Q6F1_9PSEU|nr:hypothetical protein [Saccharopolyspora phatthalungensis]MBB5155271.1 hypothetical protein [Saccharopolyspora phatthalungensis]